LSSDPKDVTEFGENEKRQLSKGQRTLLHVFQYPCAVTESLKSQGIEIREARDLDSTPVFMALAAVIVRGQDLDIDSEL
jgi:hypothetical protein